MAKEIKNRQKHWSSPTKLLASSKLLCAKPISLDVLERKTFTNSDRSYSVWRMVALARHTMIIMIHEWLPFSIFFCFLLCFVACCIRMCRFRDGNMKIEWILNGFFRSLLLYPKTVNTSLESIRFRFGHKINSVCIHPSNAMTTLPPSPPMTTTKHIPETGPDRKWK